MVISVLQIKSKMWPNLKGGFPVTFQTSESSSTLEYCLSLYNWESGVSELPKKKLAIYTFIPTGFHNTLTFI